MPIPFRTYHLDRVRRISGHHHLALRRHGDSLLVFVRLHHLAIDRLERLREVSRVLHEEVGQESGRHERALAEPPGGQAEEDAEGLDQRDNARQDPAFVKVGKRQRGLISGKLGRKKYYAK